MFVVFWTLLHLLQQSVAIGDFYVPSNNTTEEKLPLNFDTKRIRKRLKEPIDMYGSRYSDIYVSTCNFQSWEIAFHKKVVRLRSWT